MPPFPCLSLPLQVCLAAAASCTALWSLARRLLGALLPQRVAATLARAAAALFLAGTCLLALSRSVALVIHYGAPMRIYSRLPAVRAGAVGQMCPRWQTAANRRAALGACSSWQLPARRLEESLGVLQYMV